MIGAEFLIPSATVLFISFLLAIIINWKNIVDYILRFEIQHHLACLGIILFAIAIRFMIPTMQHKLWTDEFMYIEAAKNIMNTFSLGSYEWSLGWPLLLIFPLTVFGMSNYVPIILNIIIGGLTCGIIYYIAFNLTGKFKNAILASLVFAMMPAHIAWSATGENLISSQFFFILSLFFIIFTVEYENSDILAISTIFVAILFRPENLLLIPIYVISLFIYDRPKSRNIIIAFVFLLLALPNILNMTLSYTDVNHVELDTDGAETGSNFAFQNLISNTFTYGRYVFDYTFQPITILIIFILGLYFSYREEKKDFKLFTIIFILLWILFFSSWMHTNSGTDDPVFKTKFFIMFYPMIIFFFSYGMVFLKKHHLDKIILWIVLLSFVPYFSIAGKILDDPSHILETKSIESIENDMPANCILITHHPEIFASTQLNVISFDEEINLSYCHVVFDDYFCQMYEQNNISNSCQKIKNEYQLELIEDYSYDTIQYRLLRIIGVLPK